MIGLKSLLGVKSRLLGAFVLGALTWSCSSDHEAESAPDPLASCTVQVDAFKEMLVVEESVVGDARARNESAGPWSFRYAVEQMTPEDTTTSDFVKEWLETWMTDGQFNGVTLDRPGESRAETMKEIILCPWMKRSPENKCDATCSACEKKVLDMSKAPFRLLAIANRMDLRATLKPEGPAGEGRFIFALTDGAADDPAAQPLAMTIIFEYALPESKSATEWANTWHGLSKHASYDEAYKTELETVTNGFAKRGVSPGRPNGSALSQLRTNESVLNWIWQLREFRVDRAGGHLRLNTTSNTPAEALNNSPILASWVSKNAEAIRSGQYEVPLSFLGGSADSFLYRWTLPGVDEVTRAAFVQGTCNGCHSQDNANRDVAFHISPFKKGVDKVSPFMWDPNKRLRPGDDDLTSRIKLQRRLLCGDTTTTAAAAHH